MHGANLTNFLGGSRQEGGGMKKLCSPLPMTTSKLKLNGSTISLENHLSRTPTTKDIKKQPRGAWQRGGQEEGAVRTPGCGG